MITTYLLMVWCTTKNGASGWRIAQESRSMEEIDAFIERFVHDDKSFKIIQRMETVIAESYKGDVIKCKERNDV